MGMRARYFCSIMLKSLFKKRALASPLAAAHIPPRRRVYAIGDVHGRLDLLEQLLDSIRRDDSVRDCDGQKRAESEIIFLGDLIDRGPDSAGVLDLALRLHREVGGVRFLMGNHEEVFLAAATGNEEATRFFLRIGGRETILSYGIDHARFLAMDMAELAATLPTLIPREHVDFVAAFEDQIVIGDYAFVHAGIKPGVPLAEQEPKHLRWIRDGFVDDDSVHEKIIVYGHTISEQVVEGPSRIGIDTGAYMSNCLTAIGLEGSERWYLNTAAQ
jgi:serine/threonine protein phosphatase 1